MTQKLVDKITQKIIHRSAVRPLTKSNPNHRLTEDGGEASTSKQANSKVPTVFIRSRQDNTVTEFRQPLQVQSHLEMPRILVQLGHIQRT